MATAPWFIISPNTLVSLLGLARGGGRPSWHQVREVLTGLDLRYPPGDPALQKIRIE